MLYKLMSVLVESHYRTRPISLICVMHAQCLAYAQTHALSWDFERSHYAIAESRGNAVRVAQGIGAGVFGGRRATSGRVPPTFWPRRATSGAGHGGGARARATLAIGAKHSARVAATQPSGA